MPLSNAKQFGEIIRKIRKTQKLTQKDLATTCGTGIRFIRELEKGKPTCELEKALRVMKMLGVKILLKHHLIS